ncbi:sensor histidine kinase [Nonomuraea sp. NPDC059007]|uniref:sensor histidine kinase n=1 Tax=Nonomuraea sp. NPDC059007 TaxID=3346692 RepID=UPI0036A8ABAF
MTLFASFTIALLCLVVNTFVLVAIRETAEEYRANEVVGAALRVVHLIKRGTLPSTMAPEPGGALQVLNSDGKVVASSPNLKGKPRVSGTTPTADNSANISVECDLYAYPGQCMVVSTFRVYEPDGDWYVYTVGPVVPWYVHLSVLAFLIGISIALTVLVAFGTWKVVANTLAPVDAIRSKLSDITATDLGQRVPVPITHDEIRALALTANETLDRLQTAVEQQRRFASDASHDLRSPITAMRAQVEEALLYPDTADWPRTAEAIVGSLDRLQAIVTDLLTLAKLDAGASGAKEPVDLADLVISETIRPRVKKVVTSLDPGVVVTGDRLRLARLLTNLIDNAERHADHTITITVREQDGRAVLEILDDGAGIAHDQRDIVFRRFTRLDASRNRDAGGTGLGLPIAREIATSHHGTLTIGDSARGARFVLSLPLREP